MQTIGLTDFWINRPYCGSSNDFTILSDKWCSLNNCTIGNGKVYYYNGLVDKQQLKCIVIDDTFYFDFSANPISDVIKQQMWILKHTKGVEYKIEFVCLWEMFKLPTIEQLNEFAKIKQEVVVPEQSAVDQYAHSIEEMRLSTGLPEELQIRQIRLPLSEYIDLMLRMTHTRLNTNAVIRHATVIHNYHNPVVQVSSRAEDLYNDSLQILVETTGVGESLMLPNNEESLAAYITSIGEMEYDHAEFTHEDLTRHATNVYNYHRGTQPESIRFEELTEVNDVVIDTEETNYHNAISRLRESTGLTEYDLTRRRTFSIEEHLDYITGFIHENLTQEEVIHFATVIYNYPHGTQE